MAPKNMTIFRIDRISAVDLSPPAGPPLAPPGETLLEALLSNGMKARKGTLPASRIE